MTHPQLFQGLLVYCGWKINWAAAYWVALCEYHKIRMLGITLPWLYSTLLNSTWLLRWVKASSEWIDRDTEVCKGIAIIRGRFVTIYRYWMAAVWRLLTFGSSVMAVSLYCIGLTRCKAMAEWRVLCFWKQETGKWLEPVRLVADLSSQTSRRGAKFERTRCVISVNVNSYHASFIIWLEKRSPSLLKSRKVSRIYNFGVFQGIFVDFLMMWTYHTQFPVSSELYIWKAFEQYQLRLVIRNIWHCVGWNSVKAALISGRCLWGGGAFPWKPISLFTSSITIQ